MINPVNLYGVVFSSLVASGFWTNFQCFNENVDCRISFYSNRFWNSLVLCLGACGISHPLFTSHKSEAWFCPNFCNWTCHLPGEHHVLRLLARIRMISRCLIFWFHVLKPSKTTFLHPNSLEMPTSQSSKATPQQLIFGVLSLAGGWHFVTSFDPVKHDSSVFLPWSNVRRGQHAGARPVTNQKELITSQPSHGCVVWRFWSFCHFSPLQILHDVFMLFSYVTDSSGFTAGKTVTKRLTLSILQLTAIWVSPSLQMCLLRREFPSE